MQINIHYASEYHKWWYDVSDCDGIPLLVSPAIYDDSALASRAAMRQKDALERVADKWRGKTRRDDLAPSDTETDNGEE